MKKEDFSKEMQKYWKEWLPSECVVFNSCKYDNMVLSNFWPCAIWYDGRRFESVDMVFDWRKIEMYGGDDKEKNEEMKKRVVSYGGINNALKLKKDGVLRKYFDKIRDRGIEKYGEYGWMIEECKLLCDCVELKYKFCKEYRDKIRECIGKGIVESTPWGDYRFGAVWNSEKKCYEGLNMSGRCAMRMMNRYKGEEIR